MKHYERTSQSEVTGSLPQFLRLPAVLKATGLGRSTVYRMVAEHTFPAPVKLAKRAVGAVTDPGRTIDRAREVASGVGEIAWSTLNSAPHRPYAITSTAKPYDHGAQRAAKRSK